MNTTLSRILGTSPVDVTKTEVYIALADKFAAFEAEANGLVEQYTTQVNELTVALDAAGALAASLQAQLDEALASVASVAEQAAAIKADARKQKIVAAIGEAKAQAMIDATANMSDEQFEAVIGAIGVASDIEAKSPLFNEIGVSAETTKAPASGESAEMKLLKQAYPQGATR